MSTEKILIAIAVSALITLFLRAIPFLLFHGTKQMPDKLSYLGKILPPAIMSVLIIYCLRDAGSDPVGIGIPKLVGVIIVAVSYKIKHNILISILAGTISYMLLLYML
jgi:branched-subunit amino acid transport protein AzlD